MFDLPARLGENEVQAAIRGALEAYAYSRGITAQFFEPYANQQGAGPRRFAADLMGVLDNARVLMLEIKALDVHRYTLVSFNDSQHAACCALERVGLPIAYAFNGTERLGYYDRIRAPSWPQDTLEAIHRAPPLLLPGPVPARSHPSLLRWLDSDQGTHVASELGGLLGAGATRPRAWTNGALILVYARQANRLLSFGTTDAEELVSALRALAETDHRYKALLRPLFEKFEAMSAVAHAADEAEADEADADPSEDLPRSRGPRP
jgi:hypothetical protein